MHTLVVLSIVTVAVSAQLYPYNNAAYWASAGLHNYNPYLHYNYNTPLLRQPVSYRSAPVSSPYTVLPYTPAAPSHALPRAAPLHAYTPAAAPSYSYQPLVAHSYAPAAHVSSQFHAQDELGQYSYGYAGGLSSKQESKRFDGATVGSYSYLDANNQVQTVSYTADDAHGFRVAATNLPVAGAVGPEPVQDTAEVVAAKEQFQKLFDEAAAAADAAGDGETPSAEVKAAVAVEVPQPVMDTAEVSAAKAEFQQLYQEAAAAAEAAPDYRRRRRRSAAGLLLPALAKTTYKSVSLAPAAEEPTPADTTLLQLKEHQHQAYVPAAVPLHYTGAPALLHATPHFYHHHQQAPLKTLKLKPVTRVEKVEQLALPIYYNHAAQPLVYNHAAQPLVYNHAAQPLVYNYLH